MAPISKVLALLSFSLLVAAQGTQFITGACANDAACASKCCGFTSGKCAAAFVANERGEGCGFGGVKNGGGASNAGVLTGAGNVNAVTPAPVVAAAPAGGAVTVKGTEGTGNQVVPIINPGGKFITSDCTSDLECTAGCCAFNTGKCAGPVIAQTRDGGCGRGNAVPNRDAADAFLSQRLGRRGPAMM
jgi:hypothetical protein